MSSFENTLSRMKDLYTYGKELNESSKSNAYTLEHSAMAADGKTYGIIVETQTDDGYCTGHTANYIPVKVKLPNGLNGSLVDIKITGVSDEDYLIGEII